MRRHPVMERLWEELEKTVTGLGYELVQATFGGPLARQSLTVYIDRAEGVSAEDCATVAEHLSVLLDTLDPIGGAYSLVVSSPGLDRPLGADADFERYAGQKALVRYVNAAGKSRRARGTLRGVRDGRVLVETDGGPVELPLTQVTAANLEYDWEDAGDDVVAE